MNKAVYKHLMQTYGQTFGWWFGIVAEIARTFMLRIWATFIMAQAVAALSVSDFDQAKYFVLQFLIINIIGAIVGAAGDLVAVRRENLLYADGMRHFHRKITSKDMAFYRDNQTGYLTSLFRQYVDGMLLLARLIRHGVTQTFVTLIAPIVVMFVVNWQLGLAALAIVLVQLVYVMWSSSKANKYVKRTQEIYRKVTGEVADTITNIVAYKSSGNEKEGHAKLSDLASQENDAFWKRRRLATFLDLPRALITALGTAGAFYIVIASSNGSSESIVVIVLAMTYMFQILRTVAELPNLMFQHDDFVTKAYMTLPFLDSTHESVRDPEKPQNLAIKKGGIEVTDVSFSYPSHANDGKRIPVFNNLNISIRGGERVGIVGLSGAGKSTLASLLMRFDEVESGSISIDGIDLRDVRQNDLHRRIAYVPQEPLLFHQSLRENIAYFNHEAGDKEVRRAAKAAHAHEFISKLPGGYDTVVGERGVKLSGGQKQRVVIARAVLKNAPIMIFDEATSALDSESEQIIQHALPEIIGKHTAIVIAHRLSTVAGLDRIIVMHEGKITEEGSHEELLEQSGRYHSLWQKQVAGNRA